MSDLRSQMIYAVRQDQAANPEPLESLVAEIEKVHEHPGTHWGHLQPRTMGDPCPICGGTEYYCAHMVDQVVGKEQGNFDAVMKALGGLYEEWCRVQREGPGQSEIKYFSAKLMDAYNRWLG